MANLKYEGEVDGISDRQLEFVSGILADRGFNNATVQISSVGKADDNYVASVKRFVVEKDGNILKMVAKIAPANEFVRARMNTNLLFLNEHVMYTCVLPKLTELEKGADIPESERFRYAICYGSLFEEPNEIILLEDLHLSDYVMLDRTKSFTDQTVKLVLKNFARLHSFSYALKKQEPNTYQEFKSKLLNTWTLMLGNEEWKPMFVLMENSAIPMLDNAKHKNLVKGSASRLPYLTERNQKIDKDNKYSVIQQGDSWTNNMLFQVQEDEAVQCCMIDYQLASENSPVADLHYMIFNCTDHETRSKHFYDWIDYYHAQLDNCLSNYGLKANLTYPREQLDADLKRFGKFAFGLGIMQSSILMMDAEGATKMKEAMKDEKNDFEDFMEVTTNGSINNTLYKARVRGLVDSCLQFGYL